eukprot:scaffold48926_cov32-Tisochrysis_lutea.AAC.5
MSCGSTTASSSNRFASSSPAMSSQCTLGFCSRMSRSIIIARSASSGETSSPKRRCFFSAFGRGGIGGFRSPARRPVRPPPAGTSPAAAAPYPAATLRAPLAAPSPSVGSPPALTPGPLRGGSRRAQSGWGPCARRCWLKRSGGGALGGDQTSGSKSGADRGASERPSSGAYPRGYGSRKF